ncbi:methyltransferase-like protein 25B [Euwallacea similis]|uniref:methyltransferase-like protein 25B n=1 Tax=Euwallacea similis TaxID=1736056 RepID=UPI00344E391C
MHQIHSDDPDDRDFLEKLLVFLKKYQWLYKFRNVDIFVKNVLLNCPAEWLVYFKSLTVGELHDLVNCVLKDSIPLDLKVFITELQQFTTNKLIEVNTSSFITENLVSPRSFGINPKKIHEITKLAPVINEVCLESGCDLIIDVGSGVGYLSHLLCINFGYPVLALEASKKLVETARTIQEKQHPDCKFRVIFSEMFVDQSSANAIENLIQKHFNQTQKVCLIGLHACGDLSVEILKLFLKLCRAQAIVIMPCCYHRMSFASEEGLIKRFKGFPLSREGDLLFQKHDGFSFANQQFLRLACQRTVKSFTKMTKEEHKRHAEQCVHRALLELVASSENCAVQRLKRKSGKSNATDSDKGFEDYLNNLGNTHELVGETTGKRINVTDEAFLLKMHEKWNVHKNDCWHVEVLMGLQAAIQGICENVILLDRVTFLKEKGLHCYKRKITNDSVSPRCWALISKKNDV